jgi:two-component system nitrate/nitrite response regulator NarL
MLKTGTASGDAGEDSAAPFSVLIVSDIRLYREGLSELLVREAQIAAVAAAANEWDALDRIRSKEPPDLVVFDMAMKDGIAVARAVSRSGFDGQTLALTVANSEQDVMACLEAGVTGYVTREAGLSEVIAAFETVVRGGMLCSPQIAAALRRRVQSFTAPPGDEAATLTAREREVVVLLDRGLSNKEIARELCVEVATAKNHVHNVLEKLSIRSRSQVSARIRWSGSH